MKKIIDYLKKYSYDFAIIIIAIIIIILFFVSYFLVVKHFYPSLSNRGFFGDMFGGINALFSGFAFLGVIYAIILQREELRLQRGELKMTREELKRTAEAQEKSEKALREQVKSMEKTAQLNGISSLLNHYQNVINGGPSKWQFEIWEDAKKEVTKMANKIKILIEK